MAINYFDAVNFNGLFDILGKLFRVVEQVNYCRGSLIQPSVLASINYYKKKTDTNLAFDRAVEGLAAREFSARAGMDSYTFAVRQTAEQVLIHFMTDEDDRVAPELTPALEFLIDSMVADDYYVSSSVVTASAAADGGNSSTDFVVAITDIGTTGEELDQIIPEVIGATCTAGGDSPSIELLGEVASANPMSETWPAGSGIALSLFPNTVSSSLLSNGDFESTTYDDYPDSWVVEVGSPGTTITETTTASQTVTISGTPEAGTYTLKYTHPVTSLVYSTTALAFDATASSVASALSVLPGASGVTATSTGTSPDVVHTIVFTGVAGAVASLSSTENFDTGSVAHAVVEAGTAGPITGQGLTMVAHAAELTALYQEVELEAETVYAAGYWVTPSEAAAGGSIEMALLDGIGGTVLQDKEGNNQIDTYDVTALAAAAHREAFFRIAKNIDQPVYLRLRKSVAEASADLTFDDVIMSPATQLYPGGPFVSMYSGRTPPAIGDKWALTTANNLNGEFQRYFEAVFEMSHKNLLLPVTGSTLISNTLIS